MHGVKHLRIHEFRSHASGIILHIGVWRFGSNCAGQDKYMATDLLIVKETCRSNPLQQIFCTI